LPSAARGAVARGRQKGAGIGAGGGRGDRCGGGEPVGACGHGRVIGGVAGGVLGGVVGARMDRQAESWRRSPRRAHRAGCHRHALIQQDPLRRRPERGQCGFAPDAGRAGERAEELPGGHHRRGRSHRQRRAEEYNMELSKRRRRRWSTSWPPTACRPRRSRPTATGETQRSRRTRRRRQGAHRRSS